MQNEETIKWRKECIRQKIQSKLQSTSAWIRNHGEELKIFVPIGIGVITTVAKVVGKRYNLHKEETIKNVYCYDRSLGHYWRLKRELSNREWLEIDKRKKNGERLADILDELKVLK